MTELTILESLPTILAILFIVIGIGIFAFASHKYIVNSKSISEEIENNKNKTIGEIKKQALKK